jgi:hypothetical protein
MLPSSSASTAVPSTCSPAQFDLLGKIRTRKKTE